MGRGRGVKGHAATSGIHTNCSLTTARGQKVKASLQYARCWELAHQRLTKMLRGFISCNIFPIQLDVCYRLDSQSINTAVLLRQNTATTLKMYKVESHFCYRQQKVTFFEARLWSLIPPVDKRKGGVFIMSYTKKTPALIRQGAL